MYNSKDGIELVIYDQIAKFELIEDSLSNTISEIKGKIKRFCPNKKARSFMRGGDAKKQNYPAGYIKEMAMRDSWFSKKDRELYTFTNNQYYVWNELPFNICIDTYPTYLSTNIKWSIPPRISTKSLTNFYDDNGEICMKRITNKHLIEMSNLILSEFLPPGICDIIFRYLKYDICVSVVSRKVIRSPINPDSPTQRKYQDNPFIDKCSGYILYINIL
jgi:hypothetical protein